MAAGLIAALLLAATTPADPVGARIAASSQAAQALQGPLDGTWVLRDGAGRAVLILQIVDPAGGGALSAAWRAPGEGGACAHDVADPRLIRRLPPPLRVCRGSTEGGRFGRVGPGERRRSRGALARPLGQGLRVVGHARSVPVCDTRRLVMLARRG